jgi:hypothetical protein
VSQPRARNKGGLRVRIADMSVPPENRRRKRRAKGKGRKGKVAQMDHANTSEANKRRRQWRRRNP